MSKKKERAWFVCPQWMELVSRHYPDDRAAGRGLQTDPKVLARRRFAGHHPIGSALADLIIDTRAR